jgi:hypothetical protein
MFSLTLNSEGLEKMSAALAELKKAGSEYSGVTLSGSSRIDDPKVRNSEILEYLGKSGRKFTEPFQFEVQQIAQAAVEEYMKRLQIAFDSAGKKQKWARQTSAAALRASMIEYMTAVKSHIENGQAPGGVKDLSDPYKDRKNRKYGFVYPIGKASGQLIEDLDTAFASGRMKLTK